MTESKPGAHLWGGLATFCIGCEVVEVETSELS